MPGYGQATCRRCSTLGEAIMNRSKASGSRVGVADGHHLLASSPVRGSCSRITRRLPEARPNGKRIEPGARGEASASGPVLSGCPEPGQVPRGMTEGRGPDEPTLGELDDGEV